MLERFFEVVPFGTHLQNLDTLSFYLQRPIFLYVGNLIRVSSKYCKAHIL